jgi:hypothetical protein
MSRLSRRRVSARAKHSHAKSQEKAKAARPSNGSNGNGNGSNGNGSIDFSQEVGLLSSQNATKGRIISDSGYINFASLYLQTARLGPKKVLRMIRHS